MRPNAPPPTVKSAFFPEKDENSIAVFSTFRNMPSTKESVFPKSSLRSYIQYMQTKSNPWGGVNNVQLARNEFLVFKGSYHETIQSTDHQRWNFQLENFLRKKGDTYYPRNVETCILKKIRPFLRT